MQYRPDIDGLRALAVLSAILFHAELGWLSGGFVGVDVFFVISGYLITSLLLHEVDAGRFSIEGFYVRRILRLFPALFVVTTATAAAAWMISLPPRDLLDLSRSMLATAMFCANLFFWRSAGYFDTDSAEKPLLHMWSLSVEEQFYLLFPAAMLGCYRLFTRARWRSRFRALVAVGTLASLALSTYTAYASPIGAYYLLPTRAWELGLGALIADGLRRRSFPVRWSNAAVWTGLLLIVVPMVFYTSRLPFPGAAALPPCIGTALILVAAPHSQSAAKRWLEAPGVVFIGLCSYSLYLWHWPLLVFTRIWRLRPLTTVEALAALLVAFLLASITWRYVEQPARRLRHRIRSRVVFSTAALAILVQAGYGLWGWQSRGWHDHFSPEVQRITAPVIGDIAQYRACHSRRSAEQVARGEVCTLGATSDEPPDIALIGDSYANMLHRVADSALHDRGRQAYIVSRSLCPPLLGVRSHNDAACEPMVSATMAFLAGNAKVREVIMVGQWANYTTGGRYGSAPQLYSDEQSRREGVDDLPAVFRRGFLRTLDALEGKQVYILEPIPDHAFDVPATARRLTRGLPMPTTHVDAFFHRNRDVFATFSEVSPRVTLLSTYEAFCEQDECVFLEDGYPLYYDSNHLTYLGALRLRPHLDAILGYSNASMDSPFTVGAR